MNELTQTGSKVFGGPVALRSLVAERPLLVRCPSYSNIVGWIDGEGCGPFSHGILSKTSTMNFYPKTKKSQAYGPLVGASAR